MKGDWGTARRRGSSTAISRAEWTRVGMKAGVANNHESKWRSFGRGFLRRSVSDFRWILRSKASPWRLALFDRFRLVSGELCVR